MYCAQCNNMLQKVTDQNKLKFFCPNCGSEYKASGNDTLVFNDDKKIYSLSKDGRTIWAYPSNHKVYKSCQGPKCTYKIVAWEIDKEMNKIYGCQCGYSWKEMVQS